MATGRRRRLPVPGPPASRGASSTGQGYHEPRRDLRGQAYRSARDDDALVVLTPAASGQVRRPRHDARVAVRPCGRFGAVMARRPHG